MSCDVGKSAEGLKNELWCRSIDVSVEEWGRASSLHLCHSSFSNPSATLPTSQLILQPFRCFTYMIVTLPTSPGKPPMPLWWCLIYPWFCNLQRLRPVGLYERCKLALERKRLKTPALDSGFHPTNLCYKCTVEVWSVTSEPMLSNVHEGAIFKSCSVKRFLQFTKGMIIA